jgi:hypothetical protein
MNKRPVLYMQTDPRWKDKPYQATGETTTIGKSGCGPTCAAMLIETLTGQTCTPVDTCAWSVQHGYKAKGQGTYYSYFEAQLRAFGIGCQQLTGASIYGNSGSLIHAQALALLPQGYYLIACMGKGNWTSSGHFIIVWWEDGKVRINDPASTKNSRVNGDLETFKAQVKHYWAVDARTYNNVSNLDTEKEDDNMTGKEIVEALGPEECMAILREARGQLQAKDGSDWSKEDREWAVSAGLFQGGDNGNFLWQDIPTREQLAALLHRFAQMMGKA